MIINKKQKESINPNKGSKMKKNVILIVIMMVAMSSFAQITGITSKDSSVVIDRLYIGSLSGTLFHTDSLYQSGFTGVRFGAMATYKPASWISFSGYGMYQLETGQSSYSIQQFWMKLRPTKKWSIETGMMSTIPTEQRPHPVSSAGQFETWSESQIPGGTLGIKTKYQFTNDFQLAGGLAVRKGMPEYSARITYKWIRLSGWYAQHDSTMGTAVSVDIDRVTSTFVLKTGTIADNLVIKISKKHDLSVYSDVGYDFDKKSLVRGEWGIFKSFQSKVMNGLICLGYRNEAKSVVGYLFIYL